MARIGLSVMEQALKLAQQDPALSPLIQSKSEASTVVSHGNIGASIVQQVLASTSPSLIAPTPAQPQISSARISVIQHVLQQYPNASLTAAQEAVVVPQAPILSSVVSAPVSSQISTRGAAVLQSVLFQCPKGEHPSAPVSTGARVTQIAASMAQVSPPLVVPKKTTTLLGRVMHAVKGSVPPEDIGPRVAQKVIQNHPEAPLTKGQKVAQKVITPEASRADAATSFASPSVEPDMPLYQKIALVGAVALVGFIAIKALWNRFMVPAEPQEVLPRFVPITPIVEEPSETGGNESERAVVPVEATSSLQIVEIDDEDATPAASIEGVVEEPSETAGSTELVTQAPVVAPSRSMMTPARVDALRRFITSMDGNPELQAHFIRCLHERLCS